MSQYDQQKKEIIGCIKSAVARSNQNVFDALCDVFMTYFEKPSGSMVELRKATTKRKGLLFEVFCMMYLQAKGYEVWMLKECPKEILEQQGLKSFDMGIDLIARFKNSKTEEWLYVPIQCKYRCVKEATGPFKFAKNKVGWKEISTFISLCARTGKWVKNIIMTNAESVRWAGKKSKFDYVIAKKSFQKITNHFWLQLAGLGEGHKLGTADELLQFDDEKSDDEKEEKKEPEPEEMPKVSAKELRQKWLDNFSNKK